MTQDEFEKLRARLEEQLRRDIEMLYEAHRVKLRAFETIRQARAELDGSERPPAPSAEQRPPALAPAARPAPAPAPAVKTRGEAWSVLDGVVDALAELPAEFDKYDLVRALGQKPSKATLARALDTLCKGKVLAVSKPATGRTPARFRKLRGIAAPEPRGAEEAEPEAGDGSRNATEPV